MERKSGPEPSIREQCRMKHRSRCSLASEEIPKVWSSWVLLLLGSCTFTALGSTVPSVKGRIKPLEGKKPQTLVTEFQIY